jgi:hypothetical protein
MVSLITTINSFDIKPNILNAYATVAENSDGFNKINGIR